MGRFLAAQMIRRGFEVSSASGGEEALRVRCAFAIRLWCCSIFPAGANALDLLGRIKQAKPDVCVVMLSSRQDPEIIFTASKLGADEYLPKPFEAADLDLRINKILDKQRVCQRWHAAARPGSPQP